MNTVISKIPSLTRKTRLTTLLTIAAVAFGGLGSNALGADIGPAVSFSQSGWVGPYKINYAYCSNSTSTIKVGTPFMAGFDATYYLDRQQVGWQAQLYRVDGQTTLVRSTSPEYAWTNDQDSWGASFPSEYRYWGALPPGQYAVVIHMMWYSSSWVANGGMAMVVPAMAYGSPTQPAVCTIR